MSQPVKLSDALVLDARIVGEAKERSIAGQVEFWAKLGRSMELFLDGQQVLSLSRTAGAKPLTDLVAVVGTPKGREIFRSYLEGEPFPHYEAHPTNVGWLIRTEENGSRTIGRFVNRVFVAAADKGKAQSGKKSIMRQEREGLVLTHPKSTIPRFYVGTKMAVKDGDRVVMVHVTEDMVGQEAGEVIRTQGLVRSSEAKAAKSGSKHVREERAERQPPQLFVYAKRTDKLKRRSDAGQS